MHLNKPVLLFMALVVAAVVPFAIAQNASNSTNSTLGNGTAQTNGTPVNQTLQELVKQLDATPVQSELQYYVEAGETREIGNFSSGGQSYFVLKVNGKNVMLFDASGQPITDEAKMRALMTPYLTTLPLPFKKTDLNSFKFQFGNVNSSWEGCKRNYYDFRKGVRVCIEMTTQKLTCDFVYSGDFGIAYMIPPANGTARRMIENATARIDSVITEEASKVGTLEAGFDALVFDQLQSNLYSLQNSTKELRAAYNLFNAGHTQMLTYGPFAVDGGINRCKFDSSSLTEMERILDTAGKFQTVDETLADFTVGTKARYDKGQVKKLSSKTDREKAAFEVDYNAFKQNFTSVNTLEPTAANNAFNELSALANDLKAATNASIAQNKYASFSAKLGEANRLLAASQPVLADYSQSLQRLNNASGALIESQKVFGTSDSRITLLKQQYSELKAAFELKEADLKAGRAVSAADFQNISASTTALTETVKKLPRKENEVDWLLIAGVIVLLALLGAGIYFLRKYKDRYQPLA